MSDEMQASVVVTETIEVDFPAALVRRLLLDHVRSMRAGEEIDDGQVAVRYYVDDDQTLSSATIRYQRRVDR